MSLRHACFGSVLVLLAACSGLPGPQAAPFDVLITSGTVYDGSGGEPYVADVAIRNQRIVAIGNHVDAAAGLRIDASGLAVAPGFINMLSWAPTSLIQDGRSQGDIRQGVTLEVFGEGQSYGPLNETMKAAMKAQQQA